jgi:hypothetical protein
MEDRLTPEDRETLALWMADRGRTTTSIMKRLVEEGYDVPSQQVMTRHRARGCWERAHGAR